MVDQGLGEKTKFMNDYKGDSKLYRAVIAYVLKEHGTQKKKLVHISTLHVKLSLKGYNCTPNLSMTIKL